MQRFVIKNVTKRTPSYIKRYLEPKPYVKTEEPVKDDVVKEQNITAEPVKEEVKQTVVEMPKEEPKMEKKPENKVSTRKKRNNTKEKRVKDMETSEKVKIAAEILEGMPNMDDKSVKRVKKDKGLIERVESSKIILTEDNKELLND